MSDWLEPLAKLIVEFGCNVQRGQVLSLRAEPGQEEMARAVAAAAYRAGAKFVDLKVFDPHLKRARALYADPETLGYVPPWYGEAVLALGRMGGALVSFAGASDPSIMDGVDPELLGRDMLPRLEETNTIVGERLVNWCVAPCPSAEWAALVFPELDADAGLARLWEQIAHVCRLDTDDPVAAWDVRLARLTEVTQKLTALELDELLLDGPGTSLRVGLLAGGQWASARWATASGIVHAPNIPTEEVFTTPDPERVEGHVRATKPLFASGTVIERLEVTFAGGRVTDVRASAGAETFRALASIDADAGRLGEVALVDGEGRIGPLGTVFYDTLLDENAASHIALGSGFPFLIEDPGVRERVNESKMHLDFMIGSDQVDATGVRRDGSEVPLLRGGVWQI